MSEMGEFDDRLVGLEDDDLTDDGIREEELSVESLDDLVDHEPTVVELAFGQKSWRFGHVIVDEAQDLTPMQWRMIVRRSRGRSMTIVGDVAQRTVGEPAAWSTLLPPELAEVVATQELTINYRSPEAVNQLASEYLAHYAPELTASRSVRRGRSDAIAVVKLATPRRPKGDSSMGSLAEVQAVVEEERKRLDTGRVALIGVGLQNQDFPDCTVLEPEAAKGLEFDTAVVYEPAEIARLPRGEALLYIAITRPTERLVLAHHEALPAPLQHT